MTAQDIENYLCELGKELADLRIEQPVRILLVGGAFMSTQVRARRTTEDIDILPLNQEGENVASIAIALWNASHTVAEKHNLPYSWFNTLLADFVRAAGPMPIQTCWRTYGPLEVYIPPKDYILVLKLLANRKKDRSDIKALCTQLKIYTKQQAQKLVDTYISDRELQYLSAVPDTLDNLFPPS